VRFALASLSLSLSLPLALASCAPAATPAPPRSSGPGAPSAVPQPSEPAGPSAPSSTPSLAIRLRPVHEPKALVHVELDLDSPATHGTLWRVARGAADHFASLAAHDSSGAIAIVAQPLGDGVALVLERSPRGLVHVAYDVLTDDDSGDDPLGVLVRGDRFRGSGETLLALPDAALDAVTKVSLSLDRAPLEAEKAASSLGVGADKTRTLEPRALLYSVFAVGTHGDAVLDAPEGHDEVAWMGFPAFDVRGAAVELAEERSALANILGAHDVLPDVPWTVLLDASGSRPDGDFSVTPRYDGMLVQLGPSQRWGAPLRMALAQLLARRWIGESLRLAPSGHPPELGWFDDGVARYLALRVLARLEVLSSSEWAGAIAQEIAVLATSPYATLGNAAVAARAAEDPLARTTLMIRGALFAARESAILRHRTRGARDLENVLVALLARARDNELHRPAPLAPSAWHEALSSDDPDEPAAFDAMIAHGASITLPADALGPCFRAGTGSYVAFDAGFDVEATRRARGRKLTGLRVGSPADKAGLRDGDVVDAIEENDGDAQVPIKVSFTRGGEHRVVTYLPRGAVGRGQTWSRVAGVPEDKCGLPP
jgi:hypothetical protein